MTVLRFAMFRKAIWAILLTKMGDFADQFRPNYIQVGGVMLHEGLYTVTYVIVNGKWVQSMRDFLFYRLIYGSACGYSSFAL